ncbi:probable G-protein coupled receptor 174 [Poeciliopsis prolifica]|uniref:probable G-protein coupled receptor 174 n=1 Tax=Poeciliopsis prolifica TaxID=188132 RepID=UPI0024131784|nr:probable G-protein coupled receptor 174 [Poeciliopsis prolifica]XP_054890307.1 probable G-protein coupled receptor 174 [Poeciliopsis prolifica]XP_054890308.1 probable G-protein coupled receptor 174 [Poeciliopsis prolifica]
MNDSQINCTGGPMLQELQHQVYAVVYSIILAPGLLGNVLALWVFRIYVRETKRAVVFMMNLAVADLLQVLSLPLRIYYYLNNYWPFGHPLCLFSFYLKYVNMYASIYFLVLISVRRCQLTVNPLMYKARPKGDIFMSVFGWLLVCVICIAFPLVREKSEKPGECFSELPTKKIGVATASFLIILAELLGFIIPLVVVVSCSILTISSLKEVTTEGVHDFGEKHRALKTVLSCTLVFLLCFAPYHITMPLDFLVKAGALEDCATRNMIQRCHIITLCLASLNCTLDPIMYYFTSDEFRRRLGKPEMPDNLSRRLSCLTTQEGVQTSK